MTIATNMAGRGTDIQLGGNVAMQTLSWLETGAPRRQAKTPAPEEIEAERAKIIADVEVEKKK